VTAAVGDVVGGRFRIDSILGTGGMGVVVAATHLELGHRVAIKFLRDEMVGNPTIVDRFLREARAVVHLRTEHVCRVTDVGRTTGGAPFIVMELLEGVDLQHVVARQPLPPQLAAAYVVQACVALAEAHAAGIIHRDLKPANLFVTRNASGAPLVKVLDFGIAKALADTGAQLTHTQGALGSPGYMSPEQLQSARDVDTRTDIWALGVTLYQLLSARLPFSGGTLPEVAIKVANDPPAPLDVDPRLRAIVMRCLEKSPGRRYPDVAALAAELAPFCDPASASLVATIYALSRRGGPPEMPPPTAVQTSATVATNVTTSPANPRRRWPIAIAGLALVVGATIAVATVAGKGAEPAARDAGTLALVADARMVELARQPPADATVAVAADAADSDEDLFGGSEVAAALAETKQMRDIACKQTAGKTDPMSALANITCACVDGDVKAALAAWPHVTFNRDAMRELCEATGIKLPQ
jgi:tRNA A-37 threonylcarbamoyl transferase component Bud32